MELGGEPSIKLRCFVTVGHAYLSRENLNMNRKTFFTGLAALCGLGVILVANRSEAQPAPPLSSVQVGAVGSGRFPNGETINQNQFATRLDHGGNYLEVVTVEYGYSSSRVARFAGSTMRETKTQYILNGNRVVGFLRLWRYNGNVTSGQFTYQATSSNAPFRTLSTWINVR